MKLFCDNKAARDFPYNHVQHYRTKHVEIDRFFIKENLKRRYIIDVPPIQTEDQAAGILTKTVFREKFVRFLYLLCMYDIYVPTCGGVLKIPLIEGLVNILNEGIPLI